MEELAVPQVPPPVDELAASWVADLLLFNKWINCPMEKAIYQEALSGE